MMIRALIPALLLSLALPTASWANICNVILGGKDSAAKVDVRVTGKAVGRVLVLNKETYARMALHDELTPMDLIVIDEFPSELDPFPVAGIVSGTDLPAGCHMELLAQMLKIPFVHSKGAHLDPKWKELAQKPGLHLFDFETHPGQVDVKLELPAAEIREHAKARVKPIKVPKPDPSFTETLPLREIVKRDLNHSGQKVGNMARAVKHLDDWSSIPDLMGAPEGIYLQYVQKVKVPGKESIAQEIDKKMKRIRSGSIKPADVPKHLAEIRGWFDQEIPDEVLDLAVDAMIKEYKSIDGAFRFRSSNSVEDSIGAGVYDSQYLPPASGKDRRREISAVIRNVWKALYNYRGVLIRQMFGLKESVTSMGIEIHPSYDNVGVSGLASYTEYYGDRILKLVTYPEGQSATSPLADAYRETFEVTQKAGSGEVYLKVGNDTTLYEVAQVGYKEMPDAQYGRLVGIFADIYRSWTQDQPGRTKLDFEWVMSKTDKKGHPGDHPIVLQVKESEISPFPNPAEGVSKYIPPVIAERLLKIPRDPALDDLLRGLTLVQYRDGFLRGMSEGGKFLGSTFFFIEVEGRRILLLGRGHYEEQQELYSFFRSKSKNFKILEVGRLGVQADQYGDHYRILEILFTSATGISERSLLGDQAYETLQLPVFAEILGQLRLGDAVEFPGQAKVATIFDRDDRFSRYLGGTKGKPLSQVIGEIGLFRYGQ